MGVAAADLLLPFLHILLPCLAVCILLAKHFWQPTACWGRAVAALLAEKLGVCLLGRAAPEEEYDENSHAQCTVCLSTLQEGEAWRLGCGHAFHRACFHRWVEHHRSTCPLCRALLLLPQQAGSEAEPSGAETIVVAPFSFSDVGDTGKWWLR